MREFAEPPLLLREVLTDLAPVRTLLARNAPYAPIGGWYRPGADPDAVSSALWFQQDWVHAGMQVEGADLFLQHPLYHEAARKYCGAEVIVPHSVYVNLMAAICECGPAHTDNPKFRGRERANTPMWLLRKMLWSGLFERWEIVQATAIWWLNDVEEGGLAYWADGPAVAPRRHVGAMANTALVGDNHRMFHQVERVGPFESGTLRVTPRAELAPAGDGTDEWVVVDRGAEVFRASLDRFRVSVLWKADVYASEAERREVEADLLSLEQVAAVFDRDLEARGESTRLDLERLGDASQQAAFERIYPEATPVGAGRSIYDSAPGAPGAPGT